MAIEGSFNVTRFKADPEFYMRPLFRNRDLLWTFIGLIALCGSAIGIVVRGWSHLSVYAIAMIALAMFWAFSLFRMMLRSHEALHRLLTNEQIEPPVKGSPMAVVLGIIADVSNGAVVLSFLLFGTLLIAIIKILSGH